MAVYYKKECYFNFKKQPITSFKSSLTIMFLFGKKIFNSYILMKNCYAVFKMILYSFTACSIAEC